MIRPCPRLLPFALVVLALTLVVASPVQAGPLEPATWTSRVVSFLNEAFHPWNGLLAGKAPAARRSPEKSKPTPSISEEPPDPNTGSCIDPLGNPVPCVPPVTPP